MSKEYKFSINVYIDNESLIDSTISNLTEDKEFFRNSVQIVLIDSLVTEESTSLCLKYSDEFPENIYFVDCQGKSMAESFNDARIICLGSYISFIRTGDCYSHETLKGISQSPFFMKAPAICISAETSKRRNGSVPYNFGVKSGTVNLKRFPDKVGLILGAYFFKSYLIEKLKFRKSFANDFSVAFILDVLSKSKSYLYTSRYKFSTIHSAENDIDNLKGQYYKSYYMDSISRFIIPMLENNSNSAIIMNMLMYLIYTKFACVLGDRYMFTMGANSVNDFFNLISEAMQMIDDAIILNRNIANRACFPTELTFKILRLKYRNKYLKPNIDFYPIGITSEYEIKNSALRIEKVSTNGCFTAMYGDAVISSSEFIDVKIMSINLEGSFLRFSGYVTDVSCLDRLDYEIFAVANKEKIPFKSYPFYSLKTLFEIPFDKGHGFTFAVPLKNVKEMTVISFFIALGGMSYKIKFSFGATGAHLSEKFPHSYFVTAGRLVNFDLETKTITIRRATSFMQSRNERLFLSDIKHSAPMHKYIKIKSVRKRYHSTVDKYADRKIWLMCDSIDSNSDDAHELYSYINSLQDKRGVEAFYSQRGINPDDAFLMTAFQSTNVSCGSTMQKIIAMNADVIISNGHDVYKSLGFEDGDEIYYRDLLMADIVSFGDGFSMFRSAQIENRVYDNTTLRFCGSELELQRLLHPIYGYDKKHIFPFGYPHMDSLMSVPSRQILVCPALRRSFGKYSHIGYPSFTTEPFYSVFNALINDKRLIQNLNQNKCNLVLILPEEFAKKEYLWNKSENVIVSSFQELGYKETIEKSAMLITDYSNVAFDFAYMRKPIVYYHNPNVSRQNNISSFSYREQGFGVVATGLDELIEDVISILKSNFEFPKEFIHRREEFFSFFDRNNCQRIANAIYDYKYNHKIPKPNVTNGFGDHLISDQVSEKHSANKSEMQEKGERSHLSDKQPSQQSPYHGTLRSSEKQEIHSMEKRTQQRDIQNIRFAEPPQNSRPALKHSEERELYSTDKKSQMHRSRQEVRFVESQKNSRSAMQQTQKSASRSSGQRVENSNISTRRSSQSRLTEQQRSRKNSSTPRHATPPDKRGGFRRF